MRADPYISVGSRRGGPHPAGAASLGRHGRPALLHARRILTGLIAQQSPRQLGLLRRGDGALRGAMLRQALLRGARQALLAPEHLDAASRIVAARLWADAAVRSQLLRIIAGARRAVSREADPHDAKQTRRDKIQAGLIRTREIKRGVLRGAEAEKRRQAKARARTQLRQMAHALYAKSIRRAVIDQARARRGMAPLSEQAYRALVAAAGGTFTTTLMPLLQQNQDGAPGIGVVGAVGSAALLTALKRSGLVHKDDVEWIAQLLNAMVTHPDEMQIIADFIGKVLRAGGLHEAEAELAPEDWS